MLEACVDGPGGAGDGDKEEDIAGTLFARALVKGGILMPMVVASARAWLIDGRLYREVSNLVYVGPVSDYRQRITARLVRHEFTHRSREGSIWIGQSLPGRLSQQWLDG
jgi:hypothetical protein